MVALAVLYVVFMPLPLEFDSANHISGKYF